MEPSLSLADRDVLVVEQVVLLLSRARWNLVTILAKCHSSLQSDDRCLSVLQVMVQTAVQLYSQERVP